MSVIPGLTSLTSCVRQTAISHPKSTNVHAWRVPLTCVLCVDVLCRAAGQALA